MKQQIQLQIPEPCHENWDAMTGTQQGRFCLSCQKEVVDFSVMTDKEILNFISTASSKMCGRVNDEQLHRVIQPPDERKKYAFKYFWSVVITTALLSNRSPAQIKPPADTTLASLVDRAIKGEPIITMGAIAAPQKKDYPEWIINGKVVDEDGEPVSYASVIIKGTKEGVATNATGFFSLKTKMKPRQIELQVSSVGFIQQTTALGNSSLIKYLSIEEGLAVMEVAMEPLKKAMMGEVTVTGSRTMGKYSLMGAVVTGIRVTQYEKTKVQLKDVLGINEIRIYPNPISVNSVFKIAFNIKNQGKYAVQFTDASGKLVATQQLNIVMKNQLEHFNANMFRTGGVYFVRVTNQQSAKVYTAKLMVQ